jgi:DNA gyrase subunit A
LNGSTGIAVSMATSIPPHNLTEIIDATIALIKDPNLSISTLVNDYIHGPDFPTGGYLIPTPELLRAYETGQGFATLRAKTEVIKLPSGNAALIINEIPYQLKKSDLVTKIAGLIESKKIEHVSTLRDESNRLGIRIVIEFKRREEQFVNSVLKKLYKYTPLQTRFSMNFVVLNNNRPETCNLKTLLQHYIEFQLLIINKRTRFDLKKKEEQHHIMAGLMMALENIDPIITLIRESSDVKSALHSLKNQYHFSEKQAKAILEMRLQRLVSLEKAKIVAETLALQQQINELKHLLESKEVQINSLIDQLQRLKHEYGSERNTVLLQEELEEITDAELIPQEAILITLSQHDYIKRCPLSTYRLQLKGGVGVRGLTFKDNDALKQTLVTSTHDKLLFFSNKGKCYALAGYELPSFSREARGIPLINILPLTKDEKIPTILAIRQFELNQSLLFVTKNGIVKKTLLSAYQTVQKNGKIAISLKEDDELITVLLITENNAEVFLATDNGFVVRFKAADLRLLQRSGMGVKGVNVKEGNVISACIRTHEPYLLTISEKGLGKITNCELYRLTRRAAKGVKSLKVTSRTGKLIAIKALIPSKTELLLYTNDGMIE